MFHAIPYRAIALLIPVLVLSIHVVVMAATLPYNLFLTMIGLMVAYILPPAGKETVIPVGIALGIPWWYMALSIAMIDIETGLFMALNFDYRTRISSDYQPALLKQSFACRYQRIHMQPDVAQGGGACS
jgi:hypothetical protein